MDVRARYLEEQRKYDELLDEQHHLLYQKIQ